ncbi:MAG: hypothetical protein JWP92_438 [Caulobacter sp.]|nr:hypothetical protein [Caulobacter sp.]
MRVLVPVFLTIWLALAAEAPASARQPAPVSGYGGERAIVRLSKTEVLFQSGRVGTASGGIIGVDQAGGSGDFITAVRRHGADVIGCGAGRRRGGGYFSDSHGELVCLTWPGGQARRGVLDGRSLYRAALDLRVGAVGVVLARHARRSEVSLLSFDPLTGRRLTNLDLLNGRTILEAAIAPNGDVLLLRQVAGRCFVERLAFAGRYAAPVPVAAAIEAPTEVCRTGDRRLLYDAVQDVHYLYTGDGEHGRVHRWTDDGTLIPVADAHAAPNGLHATILLAHDGALYFDAGVSPDRGPLVGVYDLKRASLVRHSALPGKATATLLGLLPPAETGWPVEMVLRNEHWSTAPLKP